MKRIANKIGIVAISATILLACGTDKQKQLIDLKKERSTLDEQIALLEKELANDTTIQNSSLSGTKVFAQKVQKSTFKHFIEIHGKLDGEENVQVYPKGQGVVQKVHVKLGDKVKKGSIIATLDAGAIQKSYDQTKTQYELAKDVYERQERLWKQKIGSEVSYLQAKSNKEALEQGLAAIKEQLDNMTIKSPITGTIEDIPLKIGMAVSPAMPAATVINFSSTKAIAEVAEAYSNRIRKGDKVTVIFPDIDKEVEARVSSTSNYINPINRSFKIEVKLPKGSENYKANMIVILRIVDYQSNEAISIPVNLIQTDSKGNYVYVVRREENHATAMKKYITQGMSYNGIVEITDGINEGDEIITSGHLTVSQGTNITL